MSQAGRNLKNDPSSTGLVSAGDTLGDTTTGHHVVIRSGWLSVPPGGFRAGESNDQIHWSNGYTPAGLGPAIDGRILNPDGSSK